ncbi:MAG: uroporphyrinogen decarboxylase [Nitrososphaerales archaeon]
MSPRERFLAAARGENVDRTPVWFMRQAGRYLPEYRELHVQYSILDICKTPELSKEVTLMPVKLLGVDSAVMFADIMLPLEGMGVKFHIIENLGPVILDKVRDVTAAEKIKKFEAKRDVPYVLEGIKIVKDGLKETDTALVGFSGAPFTIASYLIEGQPSRDYSNTKNLIYNDKGAWDILMKKLSEMVSDYLAAQIEGGADAVQLFDSWVGALSVSDYVEFVVPYTRSIFSRLARDYPDVPKIHFGVNTFHLLKSMNEKAGGDVFSIDWRIPISVASEILGKHVPIQGNLEPAVLLSRDREFISQRTQHVLDEAKDLEGHIFNLGHGVMRETPVENAKFVVDYVHTNTS